MYPILSCFSLKSTDTGDDSEDSTDLSDEDSDMEDDLPAVTDILPISSDEEAELESQRINISDLFRKSLPEKVHGLISSHSNDSAASVVQVTKKEPQKQQTKQKQKKPVDTEELKNKLFTIKFKPTTGKRKKAIHKKIQEHKSKKIVLEIQDSGSLEKSAAFKVDSNTEGNASLQVVEPTKKRNSSKMCKSTDKPNSSIICGIIFASSETHIIKFQCKKCRKLIYDIDNFSKHLHKIHGMLSLNDFSSDLKSIVNTANMKELRPDKNLLFKQCGKVELINGKKLCFACTLCKKVNYVDLSLLRCHLKECHTYFVADGSDLTHLQRVEVKGEVFIIKHLKKPVDKAKEDNGTEMEVSTSLPTLISSQNKDELAEDFSEVSSLPIPAPDTPPPESDDLIKSNVTNIPVDPNDKIRTNTQRKTKKSITRNSTKLKQNETVITSSKKAEKMIVKKPISMKPLKLSITEMLKPNKLKTKLDATIKANLKQTTLFDIVSFTKMDTIPTNNSKEQTIRNENPPQNVLTPKIVENISLSYDVPKDLTQQPQALPIEKITVHISPDVHNDFKQKTQAFLSDIDMTVQNNLTLKPLALDVDNEMNKFKLPDPSNHLTKLPSVMAVNNKIIDLLPHASKELKQIPTALPTDKKMDVDLTKKESVVHAANEVAKFVLPVSSNILKQQRSDLSSEQNQKSPALPVDNKVDVKNNSTQQSSELQADNKMNVIIVPDPSNDLTQKSPISVVNKETNIDILSHLTKDFHQQKSPALPVDNKVEVNMELNVSNNLMPKLLDNPISSDTSNDLTQKPPVSPLPKDSNQIPSTLLEDNKINLPVDEKIVADMESHLKNNIVQKPPSPPESVKSFEQILYVITELNEKSSKSQLDVTNKKEKPTKRSYKKHNTKEPPTQSTDQNKEIIKLEKRTYNKSGTNKIRFTCEICSRTFKKNSRLAEHKRLHTGEKPYACDICGKSFRIKRRLTEHKMRHRKEKTFKCEKCELAFVLKQDYTLHMRHHTGDRRHQCTMCSKAFVRSVDLTIHKRVHTGEKPFACEICGRTFRANQNLFVHRRSHLGEKNFKCEHCDKTFLRNIDRKVHMRTHTGERPFKCEICGRGYSSRVHVRSHIEREHMGIESKNKSSTRKPYAKTNKKVVQQNNVLEENEKKLLRTRSSSKLSELDATVVRVDNSEDSENLQEVESMLKKEQKDLSINCFKSQVSVTLSMQVEKLPVLAVPKNENDSSILTNGNATPSALTRK